MSCSRCTERETPLARSISCLVWPPRPIIFAQSKFATQTRSGTSSPPPGPFFRDQLCERERLRLRGLREAGLRKGERRGEQRLHRLDGDREGRPRLREGRPRPRAGDRRGLEPPPRKPGDPPPP